MFIGVPAYMNPESQGRTRKNMVKENKHRNKFTKYRDTLDYSGRGKWVFQQVEKLHVTKTIPITGPVLFDLRNSKRTLRNHLL